MMRRIFWALILVGLLVLSVVCGIWYVQFGWIQASVAGQPNSHLSIESVAVAGSTAPPYTVKAGDSVTIKINVVNDGGYDDKFMIDVLTSTPEPGKTQWDSIYASPHFYLSSGGRDSFSFSMKFWENAVLTVRTWVKALLHGPSGEEEYSIQQEYPVSISVTGYEAYPVVKEENGVVSVKIYLDSEHTRWIADYYWYFWYESGVAKAMIAHLSGAGGAYLALPGSVSMTLDGVSVVATGTDMVVSAPWDVSSLGTHVGVCHFPAGSTFLGYPTNLYLTLPAVDVRLIVVTSEIGVSQKSSGKIVMALWFKLVLIVLIVAVVVAVLLVGWRRGWFGRLGRLGR